MSLDFFSQFFLVSLKFYTNLTHDFLLSTLCTVLSLLYYTVLTIHVKKVAHSLVYLIYRLINLLASSDIFQNRLLCTFQ
jgi:hypothetical protein